MIDGEPDAAAAEARTGRDARKACMSYDIDPMTLGYHQCIASETSTAAVRRGSPVAAR